MNRLRCHTLVAPLIVVLGISSFVKNAPAAAQGQGQEPTPVRVDRARMEQVEQLRRVTGELRAANRSRVATREAGIILELPLRAGDRVTRGDLVARVDLTNLELDLTRLQSTRLVAEALLEEREAILDDRKQDYEAVKALEGSEAGRPYELRTAEAEMNAAKASVTQAEEQLNVLDAELALLEKRIDDASVYAPFDGIVIARTSEVGEWISIGEPIAEILATGTYDAWIDVPQNLAPVVLQGDRTIRVEIDAVDRIIDDVTPRALPLVDQSARSFPAIVQVDNDGNDLAPGMSVTAWIPTGTQRQHLTIDRDAVLQNQTGLFVYAAFGEPGAPASAVPVNIEVLFETGERVAVRAANLPPGAPVIVEGNERLFPGAAVQAVNQSDDDRGEGVASSSDAPRSSGEQSQAHNSGSDD